MLVGVVRLARRGSSVTQKLSPCSWGWSVLRVDACCAACSCPHARGGGPEAFTNCSVIPSVVPMLVGVVRPVSISLKKAIVVVPMLVGVVRVEESLESNACSCPHARGGGPSVGQS